MYKQFFVDYSDLPRPPFSESVKITPFNKYWVKPLMWGKGDPNIYLPKEDFRLKDLLGMLMCIALNSVFFDSCLKEAFVFTNCV